MTLVSQQSFKTHLFDIVFFSLQINAFFLFGCTFIFFLILYFCVTKHKLLVWTEVDVPPDRTPTQIFLYGHELPQNHPTQLKKYLKPYLYYQ